MAAAPSTTFWWLTILSTVATVISKLEVGVAVLGADDHVAADAASTSWQYVGKFGYAIGQGTYDFRVRLRDPLAEPTTLDFELFLDEEWDRIGQLQPCRRALVARKTHLLRATQEWSPWMGGILMQAVRPHIWYFALSKCGGFGMPNATVTVEYELRAQQFDASELSVELRYMPFATGIAIACLSGFLVRFAIRRRELLQSMGTVHPVINVLAGAMLLQWAAQNLQLLHLLAYEAYGVGDSNLEGVAGVLFMLSQVVSSTLLIMISQGYTLDSSRDFVLRKAKPFAAIIALVHVLLVGHGRLQGEHSDKHHENEGLVGWTLLFVRLLLYVWFIAGVHALKRSGGLRLQPFLNRFALAGSLYFTAYPAIFVIVQLFAQYLQHPLLEIGMAVMQTASALWLCNLFLRRGMYYQVSTLSASLLPGMCCPASTPLRLKLD
mmetsp:Transcript_32846/g.94269  ORF Transcript_32846/g.94269 Transcript_32846/m.94269 type:complete len:436 (-) Transcript_32846:103-1410(-)